MPGDGYTEAEAAWAYLTDAGVPTEAIVTENAASDTWESMQGIAALLQPLGIDEVILVSDGFHLFRSRLMARDVGLQAWGSPAEMSPIRTGGGGELSYVMREAAAVAVHLWQTRIAGYWPLAVGYRLSAIGYQLSAVGFGSLTTQDLPTDRLTDSPTRRLAVRPLSSDSR